MSKQILKEKAVTFRLKGHGIGEISKTLNVSKSTVSVWCRDIALTPKQIQILARRSKHHATEALLLSAEKQRAQREIESKKLTQIGQADVGDLTKRDIFMVGLGLYWGEGYKQGSQELGFTNSNPLIIKFYLQWLEQIYKVTKKDLILRVSINSSHGYRVEKVQEFWSNLIHVPISQFTKPSLIKTVSQKQYSNHNTHYGTLRVKVRKGTSMRRKILCSISSLSSS
jgi:hypothetical protein